MVKDFLIIGGAVFLLVVLFLWLGSANPCSTRGHIFAALFCRDEDEELENKPLNTNKKTYTWNEEKQRFEDK